MAVIQRTFTGLIHLLGGLVAVVVLVLMFVAWQFSKGPIPIGFLSPYIEAAVNQDTRNMTLKMGETILTWAGWERALDIRVLNIQVIDKTGTVIGAIPEAAFSMSGAALIEGRLAPKSVDLFGPSLRFQRDRDGNTNVGFGVSEPKSGAVHFGMVDALFFPASENKSLGYLTRVSMLDADITVTDQMAGRSWHMPSANVHVTRFIDRLNATMALVVDSEDRQSVFDVDAEYLTQARRLNLNVKFDQISSAMFAVMTADLAPFQSLDMPFSGQVSIGLPIDGRIDTFSLTLFGGAGEIHLPAPFSQTLNVQSVALDAVYAGNAGRGEIRKLDVKLANQSTLRLPLPTPHDLPLSAFSMSGAFKAGGEAWTIDRFEADLGGPKLAFKGKVEGLGKADADVRLELEASLSDATIGETLGIWPKTWNADVRKWVASHIPKATIPKLAFVGKFRLSPAGAVFLDQLDGTMNVTDAVVNYLPPLPPVDVPAAHMVFDQSTYTIHLDRAHARGMNVTGGTIVITGLDQFDQFADIDLKIDGPAMAQLDYIDNKPLEFASALGIRPDQTGGTASTRLKLFFILEKTLGWDDVQVWVRARLRDISMNKVFMGRGIQDGQLDLKIDKRGMDVSGAVKLAGIPATFVWRENFAAAQNFKSRYIINAEIPDVAEIRDLGLDMAIFSDDFIRGAVNANLVYTVLDKANRYLEVKADLTDAEMSAPALRWSKTKGVKGSAEATLNLAQDAVVGIPKFLISADDLHVSGTAKYAPDGTGLERIDFSKLVYGRTDMEGSLTPHADGGWEAGFQGRSFDLSPMWEDIRSQAFDADGSGDSLLDRLTLVVELKQVWLDETKALRNVSGTFVRDQETWRTVLLNSQVAEDANFEFSIQPGPDGNRELAMRSDNAGEIFKFLDFYENMVGGKLSVTGTFDDLAPDQPLTGLVSVDDYRIVNAPALARLLSIMALTGILDALEGEGLAFADLEIPFEAKRGTFEVKKARASGASLGFTGNGKVFRYADVVNLEGTVIPAYALNSAFGRIPLLGNLFTGGEKGGGVFAATYSMTGPIEEPIISVNPLSALAPGFLKNVFGIFGKADDPPGFLENTPPSPRLQ